MKYGEWTISPEYVDAQECDCLPMARCGCVLPAQRAWSLDMDSDCDDPPHTGIECFVCGATWLDGDA